MVKFALLFIMLAVSALSRATPAKSVSSLLTVNPHPAKKILPGMPVYIQIFKEERRLELYGKTGSDYRLIHSYRICNFSGGLGPKRRTGDFKSPEGFYSVGLSQLKPDSHYYRAINIGFPNDYDRQQGYLGNYLMIHGACISAGCYAMTDAYINEIYNYVAAALHHGQARVEVSIFPFRMTPDNMERHRYSYYYSFWQQLQPGYAYFIKTHQPPSVSVNNGKYVLDASPSHTTPFPIKPRASLAFAHSH